MSDLLREAGYKETRVITPGLADDDGETEDPSPISIIKYLSNLVATRSLGRSAGRQLVPAEVPTFKARDSRSVDIRPFIHISRQIDSAPEISPSRPVLALRATLSTPNQSPLRRAHGHHPALAKNLRHAASSPVLRDSASLRKRRSHQAPLVPPVPALPSDTWLASLSKALALPAANKSPLGNRTNSLSRARSTGANARPSPIHIRKPRPAQSAVSRTSVTCRSSPASRASSLSRRKPSFDAPILGVTRTDDEWTQTFVLDHSDDDEDSVHPVQAIDDGFMDEPDDDDEHTPVTLSHILAPRALARRQRSIVSLRRNLQSMAPVVHERVGTWGAALVDDDGFPILSPTQPPAKGRGRRQEMISWRPEDV